MVAGRTNRKHDRNFNHGTDHGGQGCPGIQGRGAMAVATTSSMKLLAPINAPGAATVHGTRNPTHSPACPPRQLYYQEQI
jgi:hypothetical protein